MKKLSVIFDEILIKLVVLLALVKQRWESPFDKL